MTEDQHRLFWRLWSDACDWQGWAALPAKEREQKRREILSSLGFTSATLIDAKDGFDSVKKRLLQLAGRVVNERADAGHRRRILARIGEAIAELNHAEYPQHSLDTILRARFKVIPGVSEVADLDTRELINLSKTLAARLASWNERHAAATALDVAPAITSHDALCSASGTAPASPRHTICSPHAAELPPSKAALFSVGN
jgi:hypothetical protein